MDKIKSYETIIQNELDIIKKDAEILQAEIELNQDRLLIMRIKIQGLEAAYLRFQELSKYKNG